MPSRRIGIVGSLVRVDLKSPSGTQHTRTCRVGPDPISLVRNLFWCTIVHVLLPKNRFPNVILGNLLRSVTQRPENLSTITTCHRDRWPLHEKGQQVSPPYPSNTRQKLGHPVIPWRLMTTYLRALSLMIYGQHSIAAELPHFRKISSSPTRSIILSGCPTQNPGSLVLFTLPVLEDQGPTTTPSLGTRSQAFR